MSEVAHSGPSARPARDTAAAAPCRLAAHVLRATPPKPWGTSLLGLRDRLVEGAARESHPPAVAELQRLAAAAAGGAVAACIAGEYSALGAGSRAELGDDWLVGLLAEPLLQLAARCERERRRGTCAHC